MKELDERAPAPAPESSCGCLLICPPRPLPVVPGVFRIASHCVFCIWQGAAPAEKRNNTHPPSEHYRRRARPGAARGADCTTIPAVPFSLCLFHNCREPVYNERGGGRIVLCVVFNSPSVAGCSITTRASVQVSAVHSGERLAFLPPVNGGSLLLLKEKVQHSKPGNRGTMARQVTSHTQTRAVPKRHLILQQLGGSLPARHPRRTTSGTHTAQPLPCIEACYHAHLVITRRSTSLLTAIHSA